MELIIKRNAADNSLQIIEKNKNPNKDQILIIGPPIASFEKLRQTKIAALCFDSIKSELESH